ncbi:MAG: redoxin domain-containing protein [Gemmatimonadota bacterium]
MLLLGFLSAPLLGCGATGGEGGDEMEATPQQAEPLTLGPRDGFDLPPTDLERVAVGTMAPDFSLRTIAGDTLTLSALRGAKNVVLVFYRGHW